MNGTARLFHIVYLATALSFAGRSFAQAPDRPAIESESPTKAEARAHFKHGIELYQDNDPQSALIEFRRAYELAPAYQVLFNIGQVCFLLKDYAGALAAFEKYLAGGSNAIPADRRARVEQDIATLRERIATISVDTEPGATIFVDGVAVGTAPLAAPVPVSIGRRTIRAALPPRDPVEKTVVVAGGDVARVSLPFIPKPEAVAPQATTTSESHAASRSVPWPLWGVTGALAVGAAVTGGLAYGASNSAADIRKNGGSFSAYQTDQQTMRNLGVVTDIVGGTAIALAVVATIVTLSSGSSGAGSGSGAGGSPAPTAVSMGVGPAGTLQLRF
jgi:hypothetical protein